MDKQSGDPLAECFAYCRDGEFVVGNDLLTRRYRLLDGGLLAAGMVFAGREWLPAGIGVEPDAPAAAPTAPVSLETFSRPLLDTGVAALVAELVVGDADDADWTERWTFSVVPGLAAITISVDRAAPEVMAKYDRAAAADDAPTGAEREALPGGDNPGAIPDRYLCERWQFAFPHAKLREYRFADQTDRHDNLLQVLEYRLSPVEPLKMRGGLFAVENPLDRSGLLLLKLAPLPERRPAPGPADFQWNGSASVFLGADYPWAVIGYTGGAAGATAALQRYQQSLRVHIPGRDGLALSNTWGDRNRDAALGEAFLLREIDHAADLGLDVCQIDDGWQAGVTKNSAVAAQTAGGGRWGSYHEGEDDFWAVHPGRFPRGLGPLTVRARERGVGLGLWFSPDSADDFAHWEKDADTVLRLEREYGAGWIKIDGISCRAPVGEANLRRFFQAVRERARGRIVFDLDVTAQIRPGYFGVPNHGPLFVENRYTDWRRYWPYATFRNLWQLSQAIAPARLRMEVLNPERHADKYQADGDDPLAPVHYGMDWCFASVMVASPLLWCELSGLPDKAAAALRGIVEVWRRWREELHTAIVQPIGPPPDGGTTSGFFAATPAARHLILLRDLDGEARRDWTLPAAPPGWMTQKLAGEGECEILPEGRLRSHLPQTRGYLWIRQAAPE